MSWHPDRQPLDADREPGSRELGIGDGGDVLARLGDAWHAVEDRCTHAGCAFSEDATLEGATIVCDCHGSEFDIRTGALRRGPPERPVRAFAVRVAGDLLELEL